MAHDRRSLGLRRCIDQDAECWAAAGKIPAYRRWEGIFVTRRQTCSRSSRAAACRQHGRLRGESLGSFSSKVCGPHSHPPPPDQLTCLGAPRPGEMLSRTRANVGKQGHPTMRPEGALSSRGCSSSRGREPFVALRTPRFAASARAPACSSATSPANSAAIFTASNHVDTGRKIGPGPVTAGKLSDPLLIGMAQASNCLRGI